MAKCSIFLQSMGDARDVFFRLCPPTASLESLDGRADSLCMSTKCALVSSAEEIWRMACFYKGIFICMF